MQQQKYYFSYPIPKVSLCGGGYAPWRQHPRDVFFCGRDQAGLFKPRLRFRLWVS
jgi:hypothetical protein